MRRRWPYIAAYVVALIVQVAALVGAWTIDTLSRQHMMLMRYLFAQNLALETGVFSPLARNVEVWALAAIGIAATVCAGLLWRRQARFAAFQAVLVLLPAGAAAWLLVSVRPSSMVAVYAVIALTGVVLVLQIATLATAAHVAVRGRR